VRGKRNDKKECYKKEKKKIFNHEIARYFFNVYPLNTKNKNITLC